MSNDLFPGRGDPAISQVMNGIIAAQRDAKAARPIGELTPSNSLREHLVRAQEGLRLAKDAETAAAYDRLIGSLVEEARATSQGFTRDPASGRFIEREGFDGGVRRTAPQPQSGNQMIADALAASRGY